MKKFIVVGMVLALGVTASMAIASGKPGSQVRGQGKVQIGDPAEVSVSHISVNAWVDGAGVARGSLEWIGGVGPDTIPPAFPWHIKVTSIAVAGNTARVCGVVVKSPTPADVGTEVCFNFTDGPDTIQVDFGGPDPLDPPSPLQAGNIIVR
jgi:hypothetical protein